MNWLLVEIGAILFSFSVLLILTGIFYGKKTISKSETKIDLDQEMYSFIPQRFHYDSKVDGELLVTEGEVEFSIEDFFGWLPPSPFNWLSGAYDRWSGTGKHKFSGTHTAGDYTFMLKKKSQIVEGVLTFSVTYYIPKLKQFVDLGIAFVEISVPLLVTGLVI